MLAVSDVVNMLLQPDSKMHLYFQMVKASKGRVLMVHSCSLQCSHFVKIDNALLTKVFLVSTGQDMVWLTGLFETQNVSCIYMFSLITCTA